MAAKLTQADEDLIAAARKVISDRYKENRHHIGAALRTRSGRIYTAVHLDTYVGRASVCAEAIAVGQAMSAGDGEIETIVSVRHPRPREAYREIQADFAPDCTVIVPDNGDIARVPVKALLPNKYLRKT